MCQRVQCEDASVPNNRRHSSCNDIVSTITTVGGSTGDGFVGSQESHADLWAEVATTLQLQLYPAVFCCLEAVDEVQEDAIDGEEEDGHQAVHTAIECDTPGRLNSG